jgi:hypothetical protein
VELPEHRSEIRNVIQALAGEGAATDGAIVTGWVIVVEWMDPDGGKWLSRFNGDGADLPLVAWQMEGMLHNALHESWDDDEAEP